LLIFKQTDRLSEMLTVDNQVAYM